MRDEHDEPFDLLVHLDDLINAALPVDWYFGAHEGDGSDIGIWEIED